MLSKGIIRDISNNAARHAKIHGAKPLVITEKILRDFENHNLWKNSGKKFPFIGNYVPAAFVLLQKFFVDSSGKGLPDEPAHTRAQFIAKMEIGKAYAVVESGLFQVKIKEFEVIPKKKNL